MLNRHRSLDDYRSGVCTRNRKNVYARARTRRTKLLQRVPGVLVVRVVDLGSRRRVVAETAVVAAVQTGVAVLMADPAGPLVYGFAGRRRQCLRRRRWREKRNRRRRVSTVRTRYDRRGHGRCRRTMVTVTVRPAVRPGPRLGENENQKSRNDDPVRFWCVYQTYRIRIPVRQRIAESCQRGRLVAVLFADRRRFASAMVVCDGRLSHGVLSPVLRRRVPASDKIKTTFAGGRGAWRFSTKRPRSGFG